MSRLLLNANERTAQRGYGGRFSSSGSLAMPAAIFLASSLVMRFAAARRPGSDSK